MEGSENESADDDDDGDDDDDDGDDDDAMLDMSDLASDADDDTEANDDDNDVMPDASEATSDGKSAVTALDATKKSAAKRKQVTFQVCKKQIIFKISLSQHNSLNI